MKTPIAAAALLACLVTLPVAADAPTAVRIETTGTFDANFVFSGAFTASGAINETGSLVDAAAFPGSAIHITRLMATSAGEYITLEIYANSLKGVNLIPTGCLPPTTIPPGTVLLPRAGTWTITSGTGKYATVQGNGSWGSWVIFDLALGQPLTAHECLSGKLLKIS